MDETGDVGKDDLCIEVAHHKTVKSHGKTSVYLHKNLYNSLYKYMRNIRPLIVNHDRWDMMDLVFCTSSGNELQKLSAENFMNWTK